MVKSFLVSISAVIILFCCLLKLVASDREVLFESSQSSEKIWTIRSEVGRSKQGWVPDQWGRVSVGEIRYKSCDVGIVGVKNYLITPFIPFQMKDEAEILYYDITYSIRSCDDTAISPCSENVKLGLIEVSSQNEISSLPVGSAVENELLTDMLRDEGEPLTNGQEQRTITTTNFFRPPEDRSKSGFALVFEDNGACITVNQVEVYLKVCPRVDEKFASYPKSVAPGMGFEKVEGLCVANAASSGPPRKMCTPSGKWDDEYKSSSCHCNPGYAPGLGSSSNQCTECLPGMFKEQPGDGQCQKCPKFSTSRRGGAAICQCDPGRFRFTPNDPYSQCYRNPSEPRNVRVDYSARDSNHPNSVRLTWDAPLNDGSDGEVGASHPVEVWYTMHCENCPAGVSFQPMKDGIRSRSVAVRGLIPDTTYHFRIYSNNRVSTRLVSNELNSALSFATFNYTTPAAVFVRKLSAKSVNGIIRVEWLPPLNKQERLVNVSYYYVRVRKRLQEPNVFSQVEPTLRNQKVPGNRTDVDFAGLDNAEYLLDVSTAGLNGPYCEPVIIKVSGVGSLEMQHRMQRIVLTVILLVLVFLLFISIFTIALCFYRRKHKWGYAAAAAAAGNGSLTHHMRTPQNYSLSPNHQESWLGGMGIGVGLGMNSPADIACHEYMFYSQDGTIKLPVGQKFVEPKMYESPERILAEFAREIHPRAVQRYSPTENEYTLRGMQNQEKILLSASIHGGSFSAETQHYNFSQDSTSSSDLNKNSAEGSFVYAAAKTLKRQYTQDMWRKFAIEAATLAQFNHPNVVMLHGVITQSEESPKMLVLEFCERGSLDTLLPLMSSQLNFLYPEEGVVGGGGGVVDDHEGGVNKHLNCEAAATQHIIHILRGVACGMHYLADEGYIHKVLRARNVFISGSFLPKIAGFDERTLLEEDMDLFFLNCSNSYDVQKLPLVFEDIAPWTAPEALLAPYNFSLFSDIWSFGCLIFECFSEGERPFGSNKVSEISKIVSSVSWRGFPKPKSCPEALHELMNSCCSSEAPQKRPWFSQIRAFLDNFVRSPSMQHHATPANNYQPIHKTFLKQSADPNCYQLNSSVHYNYKPLSPERTLILDSNSVAIDEVLGRFKLDKYCENFKVHGYYTMNEVLAAIENLALTSVRQHPKQSRMIELASKRFFKQIGIESKKDRSTLYKKIQSLFIQQQATYLSNQHNSPGVFVNNYDDVIGRQYLDGTL